MEDTRNNEDWDVAAYREKLLASSHGKTRKLSAKEVISLYMPNQDKADKLINEEKERIALKYGIKDKEHNEKQRRAIHEQYL